MHGKKKKQKLSPKQALKSMSDIISAARQEKDKDTSAKLVKKARRVSMKNKVKMTKELKRSFCGYCNAIINVENTRVRTRKGHVVYFCASCRKFTRIPYGKNRM